MIILKNKHIEFLVGNIKRYFNQDKFVDYELGENKYYKGRTNLKKLKEIIGLVFGEEGRIKKEGYIHNNNNIIVGGYIVLEIDVYPTLNGFNQTENYSDTTRYYKFCLAENAYWWNIWSYEKLLNED